MAQTVLTCSRCPILVGLQFADEEAPADGCAGNAGGAHDWTEEDA